MLKGKTPRFRNGLCSKCGVNPRREGQRYCKPCHNAYNVAAKKRDAAELKLLRTMMKKALTS